MGSGVGRVGNKPVAPEPSPVVVGGRAVRVSCLFSCDSADQLAL